MENYLGWLKGCGSLDLCGGGEGSLRTIQAGRALAEVEYFGENVGLKYSDGENGISMDMTVDGYGLCLGLGDTLGVMYDRHTGELKRIAMGLNNYLAEAYQRGFRLSDQALLTLAGATEQGATEIVVDLGENPELDFLEKVGMSFVELGKLERKDNLFGRVGGGEYLFHWKGKSPIIGVDLEVCVYDGRVELVLSNVSGQKEVFTFNRYYNLSLYKKGKWGFERVHQMMEEAWPGVLSRFGVRS